MGRFVDVEGVYFGMPKRRELLIETWVHEFTENTIAAMLPRVYGAFYRRGTYVGINAVRWKVSFNGVTRKTTLAHLLASLIAGTGYRKKKTGEPVEVPAETFHPKVQSRLPRWSK